ncbi:hypothetical protein SCP_1002320 [Sparassis crispa]|uniref:Uncharacterized protein n=1 Tax=Sparassis crispa TaxID=139825 RepID=A0A401GXN1_9APHY|nr:hypothetical protein SCP_1002320 [Sparassis crispa]GBE86986.1 hypothetical protein SCP_1002320 [Sparassis crispa]
MRGIVDTTPNPSLRHSSSQRRILTQLQRPFTPASLRLSRRVHPHRSPSPAAHLHRSPHPHPPHRSHSSYMRGQLSELRTRRFLCAQATAHNPFQPPLHTPDTPPSRWPWRAVPPSMLGPAATPLDAFWPDGAFHLRALRARALFRRGAQSVQTPNPVSGWAGVEPARWLHDVTPAKCLRSEHDAEGLCILRDLPPGHADEDKDE